MRLLRRNGKSKAWLGKKTGSEVNGPLFEELAQELQHPNRECVNYFRDGWAIGHVCVCASLCVLRFSLAGAPLYDDSDASSLWEGCYESNKLLIGSLREDEHEAALHELALTDYKLGRMSKPEAVNWHDMDKVCVICCCPVSGPR